MEGGRRSGGCGRTGPGAAVIAFDDADLTLWIVDVDVVTAYLGRIAALGVAALVHRSRCGRGGRDCELTLAEIFAAAIISLW